MALVPLSAGLILAAPLSRRLTTAFGPQPTMALGLALTTAGLAAVAAIGTGTGISWFLLDTFAVAFGFGLVISPGTAAAMSAVPGARAGAGSASGTARHGR